MSDLGRLQPTRRTGGEPFHDAGTELGRSLADFWSWSCSDVVGNTLRGLVAEYLVAVAVGADESCRAEWDAVDVVGPDGTKIEVKSAARVQSWAQSKLTPISFDIAPKKSWDARTNAYDQEATRSADVYVFCLLHHEDKATIDPLDVSQWTFFVVATEALNRAVGERARLSLRALRELPVSEVGFAALAAAVRETG